MVTLMPRPVVGDDDETEEPLIVSPPTFPAEDDDAAFVKAAESAEISSTAATATDAAPAPAPAPVFHEIEDGAFDAVFTASENGDAQLLAGIARYAPNIDPKFSIDQCEREHVLYFRNLPEPDVFAKKNRIECFDSTQFFDVNPEDPTDTHYYLVFNPATGTYERAKGSVTSIVHAPFEEFDAEAQSTRIASDPSRRDEYMGKSADEIKVMWEFGAECGSAFHKAAELFLNNPLDTTNDASPIYKSVEFGYFLAFVRDQIVGKVDILRTEIRFNDWAVSRAGTYAEKRLTEFPRKWATDPVMRDLLPATKVAGSADLICHRRGTPPNHVEVWDWKRSKRISQRSFSGKFGEWPCDMQPDCNYEHYTLQTAMYQWILEHNTLYEVKARKLCIFHPNNVTYQVFDTRDVQPTIQRLMRKRLKESLAAPPPTNPDELKEYERYRKVVTDFFATAHGDPSDFGDFLEDAAEPSAKRAKSK